MSEIDDLFARLRASAFQPGGVNAVPNEAPELPIQPVGIIDDLGFSPSVRRQIGAGLYNSDFAVLPPDPNSDIDNETNRLPYWDYVQAGSGCTAKVVADSASGSGYVLRFTMASGAAGDEAYIEQIVPVNASRGQAYVYLPSATVYTAMHVNGLEPFCEAQYLKEDLSTTGGASGVPVVTSIIGANTLRDFQALPNGSGIVPTDAYYVRIRVGFRRVSAADSATGSADLCEVRLQSGGIQALAAEGLEPSSYGYSTMYQYDGVTWIEGNKGGSTGSSPSIQLDANSGDIFLGPASGGKIYSPLGSGVALAARVSNNANQSITTGINDWTTVLMQDEVRDENDLHFGGLSLTGTLSKTALSQTITGSGTQFLTECPINSVIRIPGGGGADYLLVESVQSNTQLKTSNLPGWSASGQSATRRSEFIALPYAGWWHIGASVRFASNASTFQVRAQLQVMNFYEVAEQRAHAALNGQTCLNLSSDWYVPYGQFVCLRVAHNLGSDLNILGPSDIADFASAQLWARFIGDDA